ncbi:MAG: VWA domain-containing protein, partial [Bacteroidetes bacterium]|nr:VWA domain-containing protein [Bacteroidota bacterium]
MNETLLQRWRLVLGGAESDGTQAELDDQQQGMDAALEALYEFDRKNKFEYPSNKNQAGFESSRPAIARWLGDIRTYFPESVVQVIQNDALQHPVLQRKMLLEPEILEQASPDVQLVATLLELGKMIPSQTKETARRVVRHVVEELLVKLEQKTIQAIKGAINRSIKNNRPRPHEIDWHTTIRKNLKNYQPELKTIVPEIRIGFGKSSRKSLKDIVLCVDQSGSMASSVVYAAIFGAVMTSIPSVKTKMVVFDTSVVDLTERLNDPVDLLFGVQLGGGTDINSALSYCQGLLTRPEDTTLVLISDLFEAGNEKQMRQRCAEISELGVQLVVLLALNDEGAPAYDRNNAQFIAKLGVPVFACTPNLFPDLMAAALSR